MVSGSDRQARIVNLNSRVTITPCEDMTRRKKLERNTEKWLKWYLPETYYLPFEKPHKAIIKGIDEACSKGGQLAIAAERGIGKSAILYGVTLKMGISGQQRFPVYIPWGDKDKKQGFEFWQNALCYNDRLLADYPEIVCPFRHAGSVAQRVNSTWWEHTGDATGARLQMMAGVIKFPDGKGYIGSSTMNGNPRGLNATDAKGRIIRPSMVVIDDVQDNKVAASQGSDGLVKKTILKIDGSISGLKRAGASFSIVMSGNCIKRGDVMDHYLNNKQWKGIRVGCIESWPDGWDDEEKKKGDSVRDLWRELQEITVGDDGDKRGKEFYRKNKAALTKGMKLTSPKAYMAGIEERASDKRNHASVPVDAKHAVILEYFRIGEDVFMAERQQDPMDEEQESRPYVFRPEHIFARCNGRKPFERPEWAAQIIASTDINPSYGLSTVIVGFGLDQTAAVMWYGIHKTSIPGNLPERQHAQAVYAALTNHGRELVSQPVVPTYWVIDAGGANFPAVMRFAPEATQLCGLSAAGYTGRNHDKYNEYGKTYLPGQPKREGCQIRTDLHEGRHRQWIAWDTDYWKEHMQRAWLGPDEAPGSCSIFSGRHGQFAAQVCAAILVGKGEIAGKMVWRWRELPGKHDYFDAMGQAYAAAAFCGIGTMPVRRRRRYVEKRKIKVRRDQAHDAAKW